MSRGGHTLYECPHDCDDASCCYCRGGLAYCTVCRGAEGTLPTECPGRPLTEVQVADVYGARVDFVGGRWIDKGGSR